ncbi:sulfurtransferase TusA family protein [Sphingomonas montana]|uniref:sulfurtransferase TusA family protein n=1 Tax=Sphingomonas montana TaxID=1843236 RepID=UPI001F0A67B3|nr:sulfurtransferase TusA family protein [Sphingomonas montana]
MNADVDAVLVDTRGMRCPWPALRLARAVRGGAVLTHYILLSDDPNAGTEIAALAAANGWRLAREAGRYDLWT